MTKLTNRIALETAITAISAFSCDIPFTYTDPKGETHSFTREEVNEKLMSMILHLDKKTTSERKPSATQMANEILAEAIENEMLRGIDYTVSDMIKNLECCAVLSNQKVSAIAKKMTDAGVLVKTIVKGRTYFRLAEEG